MISRRLGLISKGVIESKFGEHEMGLEYESPLVPSELFSISFTGSSWLGRRKDQISSLTVRTEYYITFYKVHGNFKKPIIIICQMPAVFIELDFLGYWSPFCKLVQTNKSNSISSYERASD